MGFSMVKRLLGAGYAVSVYNRTAAKAQPLAEEGARICSTIGEAVADAEVAMTMVGYPADVEAVYLGEGGILGSGFRGIAIDFTTSDPELARQIWERGDKQSISVLDAPVSGGDIGAREGRLSIMVGGEEAVLEWVLPMLKAVGTNIVHQGPAGSGQHCKLCNQIAIASGMMGVCEALAYARSANLDPMTVLSSIRGGAAGSWSLDNLAPRIVNGDFDPGFYVKHFIKDMRIAQASARKAGMPTPGLDQALILYEKLEIEQGLGDRGTQALYLWYQQQIG